MMVRNRIATLWLAFMLIALPARAAPVDALNKLIADHWTWWLIDNPVEANAIGVRDSGKSLPDISLATRDRRTKEQQVFIDRLQAISDTALTPAERTNKAILVRLLAEQVEANGFGQRMMLFTTYYSLHQSFASMGERVPFDSKADYEAYLARLEAFPKLNDEAIKITRLAIKGGYVQPCAVIDGVGKTISGAVEGQATQTRFFAPFAGRRPSGIEPANWDAFKKRGATIIETVIAPEYKRFAAFFNTEYLPKCRKTVGASAMPQGPAWYASQVRFHTTTSLSPDQIHQIGLDEVARISARMESTARAAGFVNRSAMAAELRRNPRYYARTPEELMAAAALTAKRIDGMMPRYFAKLARLPYGIKAIPAETAEGTTTAYYSPGSPQAGIAASYYVNTSKLDQRPLFELPALTAHEAVPGHHQQIALQQELDLPEFRKHITGFTAFVEGWALYTEYLGEEMGLYDTPEKMMGRLSYEMWRACRLVVDTGIHTKGWSKEQAVAFMRENTALADANIDAEVNRYISWPGQALGYKLGEIRIRELRGRAETALGPKFDIRRFHDAALGAGAVPLDTLTVQIDDWIVSEKAKTQP